MSTTPGVGEPEQQLSHQTESRAMKPEAAGTDRDNISIWESRALAAETELARVRGVLKDARPPEPRPTYYVRDIAGDYHEADPQP